MKLPSIITMNEFAKWASKAKAGDQITYCIGENVFTIANGDGQRTTEIRRIFNLVMKAQENGNVALFQLRSLGTTTYTAMKVLPGFHAKVKDIADGKAHSLR